MKLVPTNVTIQGHRVWLQDATDATIEYVNYKAQWGGLHIENKPNMPPMERIEVHGTTPGQQKPAETRSEQPVAGGSHAKPNL